MIGKPCPDQIDGVKMLAAIVIGAAFFLGSSLTLAQEITHHFKITQPEQIAQGEEFQLKISAVREEGTVIDDARHDLKVYLTFRTNHTEQAVEIHQGQGLLDLTLEKSGLHILQIKDVEKELTGSAIIKVQSKKVMEMLKKAEK